MRQPSNPPRQPSSTSPRTTRPSAAPTKNSPTALAASLTSSNPTITNESVYYAPNTPAFLESFFGIAAAGGVSVAINYRLKKDDIAYIFDHAEVEVIIVDSEFVNLLDKYKETHGKTVIIEDTDTDAVEGELCGPFDQAVLEGLTYDARNGKKGWDGLEVQAKDEDALFSLAYTSGTTARPKGVEYTHRGVYLAALGNVVESGLNFHRGRCKYLWTLPMFHATATLTGCSSL